MLTDFKKLNLLVKRPFVLDNDTANLLKEFFFPFIYGNLQETLQGLGVGTTHLILTKHVRSKFAPNNLGTAGNFSFMEDIMWKEIVQGEGWRKLKKDQGKQRRMCL